MIAIANASTVYNPYLWISSACASPQKASQQHRSLSWLVFYQTDIAWRVLSNLFFSVATVERILLFSGNCHSLNTKEKILHMWQSASSSLCFQHYCRSIDGAKRCLTLISYEPRSSLFPLSCYLTHMSTNNQSILLSALYRPTLISYQRWYDTYLIWKSSNFISIYLEGGCSLWFQLYCVGWLALPLQTSDVMSCLSASLKASLFVTKK